MLSDLCADDIVRLKSEMASGKAHPKVVKQQLARELTARFHGADMACQAEENFERVFSQHELPEDMPELTLPASPDGVWLPKLLVDTAMVKGSGEGRRMIQQGAVTMNGKKVSDVEMVVKTEGEILLKVGKRRFCRVIFV